MTTDERLKEIKQTFRTMMNGETARSMRSKGVTYRLNWGVALPDLRRMAEDYGHDPSLAIALWKEDIRECKILATMIMPAADMSPELAELWLEQTATQEIAEIAAMNLYQWLPDAATLAFRWIAREGDLWQVAGYCTLARLFMRGRRPSERDHAELADQAQAAMSSTSLSVRHAAAVCLARLEGL